MSQPVFNVRDGVIDRSIDRFTKWLAVAKLDTKKHQLDGLRFCMERELAIDTPYGARGGVIADEMGLGKTILMIGNMVLTPKAPTQKTLIVLPKCLLDQWSNAILKFTGGYKLDDKISLEAFYLDFGEASLSGVSGNRFTYGGSTYEFNQAAKIALTVDTIGIGARYNIFNEGKSALYGIAGIHSYDVTLSVASGTGSASVTETGNDPYFGVGYNYLVADGIKLNFSYQNYEFDNDSIDGFLFGIQYDFKD
mgnify:CR=1 FL=1